MARYLALTCEALARSIYAAAARTPHLITVELFRQGLHDAPKRLRETLQAAVDQHSDDNYDALLLAYGLCGRATVGLTARQIPLVIPRAHDCITLYLGSRERYQAEFDAHPGTYWYSHDYLERREPGASTALGVTELDASEALYQEYVEKYGKDNADYLINVMGEWRKHYDRAAFIDMGHPGGETFEDFSREQAETNGWQFQKLQGDGYLINALLYGAWSEDDFLVVPPGHAIHQSASEGLVTARKADAADE